MWPFTRESKSPPRILTVRQGLDALATIGIRLRPDVTVDDLLYSLGGSFDSPVEPVLLLCVVGANVERGGFQPFSDDIWHGDAECITSDDDYVRIAQRVMALAKGALPLKDLRDHVDIDAGEAWLEFTIDGQPIHWDLQANDDWLDPGLLPRFQDLLEHLHSPKRFCVAALGQDFLLSFGDTNLRDALTTFSGVGFGWK